MKVMCVRPAKGTLLCLLAVVALAVASVGAHARKAANMPDSPAAAAEDEMFARRLRGGRPVSDFGRAQAHAGDDQRHFGGQAAAKQAIRVTVEAGDLFNTTKHCTTVGQQVTNYDDAVRTCADVDILTAEKRDAMRYTILPGAKRLIESALKLDRVVGSLMLPANTANALRPYSMSAAHGADPLTNGFPYTDFLLLVSFFPAASAGTLASAGSLAMDTTNNRSIAGIANFPPRHIYWGPTNESIITRDSVRTAAHEIMHAMGWSEDFFHYLAPAAGGLSPVLKTVLRGKNATVLRSPTIVAKVREHFNCSTALGMEIEDEGGAGTAGSHPESRTHYDDIMAGTNNTALSFLSPVSLALFADLPGYEIEWSVAERPVWMRDIGCGAQDEKCNSTAAGAGPLFCFIAGGDTVNRCNAYHTGRGSCSVDIVGGGLPSYYQYFSDPTYGGDASNVDKCPLVTAADTALCTSRLGTNNTATGQYYAADSRCFAVSSGTAATGQTAGASDGLARCLQTRCVEGGAAVEFRVGSSATWLRCSAAGATVDLAAVGFSGTVTCPNIAMLCGFRLPDTAIWDAASLTTTTAAGTTAATTTAAATTTTTTAGATTTPTATTSAGSTAASTSTTTVAPSTTAANRTMINGAGGNRAVPWVVAVAVTAACWMNL